MNVKLAICSLLCIVCATAAAEAKTVWHTYGAVPVSGDPVLTQAYSNALALCRLEGYRDDDGLTFYGGSQGSAEMRGCLATKGFIYQGGEPYAYPVAKDTYVLIK